jgi:hypothetical protein
MIGNKVRALVYHRHRTHDGDEVVAALPGETGVVVSEDFAVMFDRTGYTMQVRPCDVELVRDV